jgi:hypothetical protein
MARKKGLLDIEWSGLDELEAEFGKMDKEFEKNLIQSYTEYGGLVEEGSRALAQRDTGDMEESIIFDKARMEGDTVVVEGGSNSPYALRRHEEPYRPGVHDKYDNGAKFEDYYLNGRGRGTYRKGPWKGERPGRKFMERAISVTAPNYNAMLQRIVDKTLGDDK